MSVSVMSKNRHGISNLYLLFWCDKLCADITDFSTKNHAFYDCTFMIINDLYKVMSQLLKLINHIFKNNLHDIKINKISVLNIICTQMWNDTIWCM